MRYKKYDVHYIDKKNKPQVYRSNWSLCIDGAEEAFKLDVKGNCKEVTQIVSLN